MTPAAATMTMMTTTKAMMMMMVMMMMMGVAWLGGMVGAQPQGSASGDSQHGWDTTVCVKQPNNPGPGLPDLPESFSLRVEANIMLQHKTITIHEYYNHDSNIAAVRQRESGTENLFFYLYNSNQYLTVIPDNLGGYFCLKEKLSDTENQDMFGLKAINSTMDRIYSVKGALHYGGGNITQNYLGTDTVRGIPCNKWKSCQYWKEMNSTSTVIWYFSDSKHWSSISGYAVPVRCHVTGVHWDNATSSHPYEHIYEFYDFQADVTGSDRHFEVPRNTYCFSETNTKPLPILPSAYSFDVEKFDILQNSISFIREEYDNTTQLLRFDYREAPQSAGFYGSRYISQYHDYNTGVAYSIDVARANCTTSVIARNGFDDVNVGKADVRFKNPNEFLNLNGDYVYQGVRSIRGIECDSWAVERYNYPDNTNNNIAATWTWYFATENWMRTMGFRDNFVLPVMLEIFGDNPHTPIHQQFSFYEFNADEPNFLTWDLSPCFGPSKSANYAFLVKGTYHDVVAGDLVKFKYYVMASLQMILGVAPLRISRMDVQEAANNTLVTFDLLDKAPLQGDVVRIQDEPDLSTALQTLKTSIAAGTFTIINPSSGETDQNPSLTVLPAGEEYQLQSPSCRRRRSAFVAPPPTKTGFSGGAMGGMAVGMLVLGALIGFAVLFLIYKVRGGSFGGGDVPMQKFQNENN